MKKIIVTNPIHDDETRYLDMWITEVADYMDSLKGVAVVRLNGELATASGLKDSINQHDPRLVMFNGHGNPNVILGHEGRPIIVSAQKDNAQFNGRIVHAVVCSAAHDLGQELVKLGAKAFIGYRKKFYFWQVGDDTSHPGAKLFLEPALLVSRKLSEGATVEQSFKASQKVYAQNLKQELGPNGDGEIAAGLEHNMLHHTWAGDGNAVL
jgi:hypothetical protein